MILEILGFCLIGIATVGAGASVFQQLKRSRFENERLDLELSLLRNRLEGERERRLASSQTSLPWNGFRKFVVKKKVPEADHQTSFYLSPHDGKTLPGFLPGQYLTFQLPVPGQAKPVVRCYSLSDRPRDDYYRVTVKRQLAPSDSSDVAHGVGSGYLHDNVQEGDIIDVKAPSGHFHLDPAGGRRCGPHRRRHRRHPDAEHAQHARRAPVAPGDMDGLFGPEQRRPHHERNAPDGRPRESQRSSCRMLFPPARRKCRRAALRREGTHIGRPSPAPPAVEQL